MDKNYHHFHKNFLQLCNKSNNFDVLSINGFNINDDTFKKYRRNTDG